MKSLTWRELIERLNTIPENQLDDNAMVEYDVDFTSRIELVNVNADNSEESLENEMNGATIIRLAN